MVRDTTKDKRETEDKIKKKKLKTGRNETKENKTKNRSIRHTKKTRGETHKRQRRQEEELTDKETRTE